MEKDRPPIPPFARAKGSFASRVLDFLIPSRRTGRALAHENSQLDAFLRAVPIEYCGWDERGLRAISQGFAALFDLPKIESLQDIQAAITAGDAASLETLFDRLRHYGEHFDIGVNTLAGKKTIKVFGKQGVVAHGSQVFFVLWGYDITDFATAAMRSVETVAAVEKRENELRSVLNALPFPLWVRNEKLDLTWCNKFYARMLDNTSASVIAEQKELTLTDASKEDLGQRVLAQRAIAKNAPQLSRGHTIIDGQRRWIEVIETPLPLDKKVMGLALDVTKEEEWAASYDRLAASHREALEQLRTAIAMFDHDTRLEFYNAAYEQMTGMSGIWLNSRPRVTEIIDKMRELRKLPEQADYRQYKQNWLSRFSKLLEPYEEMQYLPDNSVIRMVIVPRPMGGVLLTMEDVTSRLQLETSYNTLMAVQKETIDNLSEAIAVFGEDGRLRLSNQSYAKMWRLPVEDLHQKTHVAALVEKLKDLFDEAEWPAMRDLILTNGLEREPRRGRLTRKDGAVLEYSVMPLPDGNILNAYFDITDTVKVEQALIEKNAALEEAEKLKTDFLANVSYQLRTPLNAMMGFAEILNQQYFGKLNDKQLEYTTNMIEAGQRLVSLVNDILDLSTIEAGYLALSPSEIDVRGLLDRIVQLTEEWAQKQGISISATCEGVLPLIFMDERRIKQVLLNLVSNSINYSPSGGKITLAARRGGDDLVLSVADTGIGIPAADLERVFTPFEKIHSQRLQRRSGAGLGLSLVRKIVELHGGSVSIESAEGAGTTVTCRLPIQKRAVQKVVG